VIKCNSTCIDCCVCNVHVSEHSFISAGPRIGPPEETPKTGGPSLRLDDHFVGPVGRIANPYFGQLKPTFQHKMLSLYCQITTKQKCFGCNECFVVNVKVYLCLGVHVEGELLVPGILHTDSVNLSIHVLVYKNIKHR